MLKSRRGRWIDAPTRLPNCFYAFVLTNESGPSKGYRAVSDADNDAEMKPQTLDARTAKAPAKYSLEMNSRWFKKRRLGPGAKIKGLEKAPEPQ